MLSVSLLRTALVAVFATTAKGDKNGEFFIKAAKQIIEPNGFGGASCQKPIVITFTSKLRCADACLAAGCTRFSYNGGTNQCHISVTGELYKRETGADVYERKDLVSQRGVAGRNIGCFRDKITRDVCGTSVRAMSTNSHEWCINFCSTKGFRIAAVQSATWCICGLSYGLYGALPEASCSFTCSGDGSQTCGGDWANGVYETGL